MLQGNGVPIDQFAADEFIKEGALERNRPRANEQLLERIRESEHANEMLKASEEECAKGRLKQSKALPRRGLFTPRFPVVQGTKLRMVDDYTISHCNAATMPTEKLRYDGLDNFVEVRAHMLGYSRGAAMLFCLGERKAIAYAEALFGHLMDFWKADVKDAYKTVPVAPKHRRYAWVGFLVNLIPHFFQHLSMPFGAVSSVHHWDRIGIVAREASVSLCCVSFHPCRLIY